MINFKIPCFYVDVEIPIGAKDLGETQLLKASEEFLSDNFVYRSKCLSFEYFPNESFCVGISTEFDKKFNSDKISLIIEKNNSIRKFEKHFETPKEAKNAFVFLVNNVKNPNILIKFAKQNQFIEEK